MSVDISWTKRRLYAAILVGAMEFIAIAKGVRAIVSARPTVVSKAIGPETFHFCLQRLLKLSVHQKMKQ